MGGCGAPYTIVKSGALEKNEFYPDDRMRRAVGRPWEALVILHDGMMTHTKRRGTFFLLWDPERKRPKQQ